MHLKMDAKCNLEAMNLRSSAKSDIVTIEPDVADIEIIQ